MNENTISTVMGAVVIIVIAGLIFNYFRTANLKTWQGTLLSDQQTANTDNQSTANDGSILATYKVVKGDDLWHIAENYYKSGYNYVDIMKENKIGGAGVIEVGMELRIPNVPAKKLTVAETSIKISAKGDVLATETKSATPTIEAGEYTTVRGDTYWDIAVRAYGDGYKWTKIFEANKKIFGNPNLIHAEVKIVIPTLAK